MPHSRLIAPKVARHAAEAARARLAVIDAAHRPRVGKLTAQAIAALQRLRRDIQIGVPPEALLDRIDDELFRLKR